MNILKEAKRTRRHARVRNKIASKDGRHRLCVHRSNRYITGQVIDDQKGNTVASISSKGLSGKTYVERASEAGKLLGAAAKKAGIDRIVFDRGGYLYAGRVKAFAEGVREAGIDF